MYIMFSTPLTCCSMGAATVSATTWAFAPGYDAETSTVGGVMSGYCAIGNVNNAIVPPRTMTIDSTDAKIGRLMKNFENTDASVQLLLRAKTTMFSRSQAPLGNAPPRSSASRSRETALVCIGYL